MFSSSSMLSMSMAARKWLLCSSGVPTIAAAGAAAGATATLALYTATTTSSTIQCEEAPPRTSTPSGSSISAKIQRKMTAIGHFSVASETAFNPSIITFFMDLRGKKPLSAKEFIDLWTERQMGVKHPRFHQTITKNSGRSLRFVEEDTDVKDHVTETLYPMNRFDLRQRLQAMQRERWNLSDSLWHLSIAGKHHTTTNDTTTTMPRWSLLESPTTKDTNKQQQQQTTTTTADEQLPAAANNNNNDDDEGPLSTVLLFRGHHALADGASIGAALADLFDESKMLRDMTVDAVRRMKQKKKRRNLSYLEKLWKQYVKLIQFLIGSIRALSHQLRLILANSLWDANPWRQLQKMAMDSAAADDDEQQLAPCRTLSWSEVASVDQVKWLADTLSLGEEDGNNNSDKITINDVFVTCVTAALTRQLNEHRQRLAQLARSAEDDDDGNETKQQEKSLLPLQKKMHIAVPVHMKGGVVLPDESVGNNIGAFVARVPGEDDDGSSIPDIVARLHTVSRELHQIKTTPAAFLSHLLAKCLSYSTAVLPVSWVSYLYAKSNCGSVAVISNNRGSPIPVHMAGRKVESLYGFVPLPPGIPIGVVVMSYAGKINCTLTAEPWAIPDGDQFMTWILEEYLQLVQAAKMKKQNQRLVA